MGEANKREVKRYGIEAVGEMDHCAVGLEQERQRTGVGRQVVRQTCGIFGRLRLDAPERSLGLGFDRMADTHPFRGRSADHSPRPRKPSLAKDRWLFLIGAGGICPQLPPPFVFPPLPKLSNLASRAPMCSAPFRSDAP